MEIKTSAMRHLEHTCDLCIVGGGLSGMAAAISAAREGVRVILIQDRPVLGGNCSSEIRMWVRGASGEHNRETGFISELEQENIYRNPTLNYSIWDSVLFGKLKDEPNIELIMNCSVCDADTVDGTVVAVKGWQLTTYTWHTVYAKYFADCSGDSVLAPVVGALWRVGREGHAEYNETIGPEVADKKTMGMSLMIQARETDHKVTFIPPKWANVYKTDEEFDGFPFKKKEFDADNLGRSAQNAIASGESIATTKLDGVTNASRTHKLGTSKTNFWWIELGGEDDSLHDSEEKRDELLKIAFGIWDHIKNQDDHGADNWELEWVGFLPGKRESRRYVGRYVINQNDLEGNRKFGDVIAYGGWPMDDHNPAGFNSFMSGEPASKLYPTPSPYQIPCRVLYSANIKNLFFAGRNVSATHAANSSMRVMATCSLLGQAMGTFAAICINDNLTPDGVYETAVGKLQDKLLDAGCFLPGLTRKIPAISKSAKMNLSDADRALLFNGIERPDAEGTVNYLALEPGSEISFDFGKPTTLTELRLMFDQDFSRKSVSVNKKMRIFAQKSCTGLDFQPMTIAATLVRDFEVIADGKTVFSDGNNYYALRRIPLNLTAKNLTVRFKTTHGCDRVHIFSCDVK